MHIRTAGAAGKVSIGFWDHWVPGGNDVMQKQVDAWAEKNKVEAQADFITSTGNKLQITGAAEAQAKTGHDALAFFNWDVFNIADSLEPIDDVMQRLIAKNGAVDAHLHVPGEGEGSLGRGADQFRHPDQAAVRADQLVQAARPRPAGDVSGEGGAQRAAGCVDLGRVRQIRRGRVEGRHDLRPRHGRRHQHRRDRHARRAVQGVRRHADRRRWQIQLKSDAIRQVLEFAQRLVKSYPADAVSFDDASNNRALISGKSALIFNPPSAWAVAKRDAPAGRGRLLDVPRADRPEGSLRADAELLLGCLQIQPEQGGGEGPDRVPDAAGAGRGAQHRHSGYDIPPYAGLLNFKVWEEVEPPKGTVYNYPIRPWHNQQPSLAAAEAAPDIAVQIYNRAIHNQMMARIKDGQTIPQVIAWAQDELEGFAR